MAETDWEARYQSGDMPWEKGEPSPGLVDFLARHPDLPRGSVLVPGCGTGNDVRAWAAAGFEVTGLDLASSAIRLARERTPAGVRASYHQLNFLEAEPLGSFDYFFEHTLFCAIDPSCRDAYTRAVNRWLKPTGQFIAIHYMLRDDVKEPPHGVTQQELMERFSPSFELVEGYIPPAYPNRVGLELLLWWKRKAAA